MSRVLPCPMCSNVIHGGTTRVADVTPAWLYASMTSAKRGGNHFAWCGCHHANPIGPALPVSESERSITDAKWDIEARRLFELRTANWKAPEREKFGRILGFFVDAPEQKSA